MAFIVEDGTGVPEANAYIDIPFFTEYFADRGVTFTEDEDVQKSWIVQATDYIEQVFGWRLIGEKVTVEQGLHFPAKNAYTRDGVLLAEDEVPIQCKRACAEYARRAKSGPLMPDPLVDATGYSVVTTRKKVGPIEKEFTVMGSSGPILVRSYPAADGLMTNLLVYAGGGTRVIR
jgi:hypothetical protein